MKAFLIPIFDGLVDLYNAIPGFKSLPDGLRVVLFTGSFGVVAFLIGLLLLPWTWAFGFAALVWMAVVWFVLANSA